MVLNVVLDSRLQRLIMVVNSLENGVQVSPIIMSQLPTLQNSTLFSTDCVSDLQQATQESTHA